MLTSFISASKMKSIYSLNLTERFEMTDWDLENLSNWPPVSLPEKNGKIINLDKKTFQTRLTEFRYKIIVVLLKLCRFIYLFLLLQNVLFSVLLLRSLFKLIQANALLLFLMLECFGYAKEILIHKNERQRKLR